VSLPYHLPRVMYLRRLFSAQMFRQSFDSVLDGWPV